MSKARKTIVFVGDEGDEVILLMSEPRLTVDELRAVMTQLYAAALRIEDRAKIKLART